MAFPSPSITPPILSNYQMWFKGLTFGGIVPGSNYQVQSITGLDGADIDSGDAQRSLDQGEFIGIDVTKGRDITIQQVITAPTASMFDQVRQLLGGVLGAAGNVESPLYVQMPSGLFGCMARPRKHSFPWDINGVFARGVVSTTMFHATDPRWYLSPTKSATVGLPAPPGGMTFPATFPLSFGGGGYGGVLNVTNAGLFEMRPVFVVTGPCVNPVIQNITIPGAPSIGVNITLTPGDTLVIDTDFQTVVYTPAGASAGSSRRNLLSTTTRWFNLPPGLNQIEFFTGDHTAVAGTLTVQSADAWASI